MMLIGKADDAESVLTGALGDAFPIDVRGDIRVADLFEWQIEMSMLGADLNGGLKIFADVAVIDDQDVTALEICCRIIDPIERGLIERSRRLGSLIDKNEIVSLNIDKFAGQIDRHGVEQLVGKMDAGEQFH